MTEQEFGLTKKGFKTKRYADIVAGREKRARELLGQDINLSESSILGILIRLSAWDVGDVWQQAEEVYLSAFVSSAEGISLDRRCQNLGLMRHIATPARGIVTFVGADGTDILQGVDVQTGTGIVFRTIEAGTIDSSGEVDVLVQAVESGAVGNVGVGSIYRLVSPISGVAEVRNEDATSGGRDTETDMEFRERYYRSIAKPGGSSVLAVEGALLNLEGVLDAKVRENVKITEDPITGLPPKCIAPIVWGGDDTEIAETLLQVKTGGIECWGTSVIKTVTDTKGQDHIIAFDRPETITINVSVELGMCDPRAFPVDGVDQVVAAILKYISDLGVGKSVIYTHIISSIHSVPGICDIFNLQINGQSTNILIDPTQVAVSGDVTVTTI